jgi:putative ABC transport system permease protein
MAIKLCIIALRNMRRQLRRTILTGLTFAVAVFIFTVLIAVPASMDMIAKDASRGIRLIVTERNNNSLPTKYCNAIRKIPHVLGCAPEIQWTGIYRDLRDPIVMTGITEDIFEVTADSDYKASPEVVKQVFQDRRGVLVGSVLMKEHHWKFGEPISVRNMTGKLSLTFIPVAELPSIYLSRIFFFNRKMLDDAVKNTYGDNIQNVAGFLSVRVDRAENLGLVANQIDENFHNSEAETQSVTESDTLANYVSSIGDVRTIIYSLCVVVLLTMLLIAANSMAMMVRDRVGEVAVMRALGFTQVHTASLLLCEATLIGVSGALVGAGLALWYFGSGVTMGPLTGDLGFVAVRPETALGAIMVAFVVSMLAAMIPVIIAARIPPALAFRKVI